MPNNDPTGSTKLKPNLDSPPPPATGMTRRVPDSPMAPTLGMNSNPISAATTTEDLLARAMDLEVNIRELVQNVPELAQIAAQFIDTLRGTMTAKVQGAQQSPMAAGNPMAALGAGAPQPAGPGAAAPPPMM